MNRPSPELSAYIEAKTDPPLILGYVSVGLRVSDCVSLFKLPISVAIRRARVVRAPQALMLQGRELAAAAESL